METAILKMKLKQLVELYNKYLITMLVRPKWKVKNFFNLEFKTQNISQKSKCLQLNWLVLFCVSKGDIKGTNRPPLIIELYIKKN